MSVARYGQQTGVVEMAASRGWEEAVQILKDGDLRLRR